MIDILIPTLGRSHKLKALVKNIQETTLVDFNIVFIMEDKDPQWVQWTNQVPNVYAILNNHERNYAGAILTGYEETDSETLFFGADDILFHPRWDYEGLKVMSALSNVKVVGTNDLLNPYVLAGHHATHYFVNRDYLAEVGGVVDQGPGSVLNRSYDHNFTDTEFIATAKARAVFAPALGSVVEHMHWSAGKSTKDSTSIKAFAGYDEDERLYLARQPLWWGISR